MTLIDAINARRRELEAEASRWNGESTNGRYQAILVDTQTCRRFETLRDAVAFVGANKSRQLVFDLAAGMVVHRNWS